MEMPPKKRQKFLKELRKPRIRYPSESKYVWLKDLLNAYHIVDAGVKIEVMSQEKQTGRTVACRKGCYACCLNHSVPVNQLEVMGLSWYVSEVMDDQTFNQISVQLKNHTQSTACPFLLHGLCSVYPVRPVACRIFHVFDKPCSPLEDVGVTRPEDVVHTFLPEVAWLVAQKMMPHLGVNDPKEQRIQFQKGFMMKITKAMHWLDWNFFLNTAIIAREAQKDERN